MFLTHDLVAPDLEITSSKRREMREAKYESTDRRVLMKVRRFVADGLKTSRRTTQDQARSGDYRTILAGKLHIPMNVD